MSGETNLSVLLQQMSPMLLPEKFVFCSTHRPPQDWLHLNPIATFREAEGTTLVLEENEAKTFVDETAPIMRCITLQVHSSLEAVGLTAAVANALKDKNISANVIAAYYHDHVFVPENDAQAALTALDSLCT